MRAVSDAELNRRISSSYARYYAKLVRTGLGFPTEITATITATPGIDTYALPPDHFSTMRVDYITGGIYIPLQEIDIREIHEAQAPGSPSSFFRLAGPNLILYPAPTAGDSYRHIYAPAPDDRYPIPRRGLRLGGGSHPRRRHPRRDEMGGRYKRSPRRAQCARRAHRRGGATPVDQHSQAHRPHQRAPLALGSVGMRRP